MMLTMWTPIILVIAVALTSALSGVLGMGGGILLMGVCTLLLPAAGAMVVHGVAQLVANGARTVMHRRHVAWRVLVPYAAGSLLGLAMFASLGALTETWIIHLILGILPFLTQAVKSAPRLSIERPAHGLLGGVVITAVQLLAGASGPLLDLFYLETRLTRHEVVATKALTQSLGHTVKLAYYGGMIWLGHSTTNAEFPSLYESSWLLPTLAAIATVAVLGTVIGGRFLDQLSDDRFRQLSRHLLLAVGTIYLVQGSLGCAQRFF